jgi:hypothetical protein
LPAEGAATAEVRQIFDRPPSHCEVTKHWVLKGHYAYGKYQRGLFPAAVATPVQYGPSTKDRSVDVGYAGKVMFYNEAIASKWAEL